MTSVIASQVLANGLRTEFSDTYLAIQNRQADSRLALVMDLGIGATNRVHEFAYFEAAPHMEQWVRGTTIPTDAFGSVQFSVPVYTWAVASRGTPRTRTTTKLSRSTTWPAWPAPARLFCLSACSST